MVRLADIMSFGFGTYDNDISRLHIGDKVSHEIIQNGVKASDLSKRSIFGLASNLGMKETEIEEAISKAKTPTAMLEAVKKAKGIADDDGLVTELKKVMESKYKDGFKNTSFLERFKINFNQVKHNDVVYRLFDGKKGASEILKDFGKEISSAKGFFGKAGKVAGKSLPFLGMVLPLIIDGPTIFKSFSQYGVGEGLKQTGRTASNMAGAAAGMALGATLGSAVPILGTLAGAMVGGFIGGKLGELVLGKSKVEEAEAQKEQQAQIAQAQQQQMAAAPAFQPSAFGTYSTQQQPYMMPGFAGTGRISLGDDNLMSDSMSAYRQYSMVA